MGNSFPSFSISCALRLPPLVSLPLFRRGLAQSPIGPGRQSARTEPDVPTGTISTMGTHPGRAPLTGYPGRHSPHDRRPAVRPASGTSPKITLADVDIDYDRLSQEYDNILKRYENHTEIDFMKTKLAMAYYYKNPFWYRPVVIVRYLLEFWLYVLVLCAEVWWIYTFCPRSA
jgi:hypothetical protein